MPGPSFLVGREPVFLGIWKGNFFQQSFGGWFCGWNCHRVTGPQKRRWSSSSRIMAFRGKLAEKNFQGVTDMSFWGAFLDFWCAKKAASWQWRVVRLLLKMKEAGWVMQEISPKDVDFSNISYIYIYPVCIHIVLESLFFHTCYFFSLWIWISFWFCWSGAVHRRHELGKCKGALDLMTNWFGSLIVVMEIKDHK